MEHLDEFSMWLAEQSDVMGELRKPLSGITAQAYETLTRDMETPEASQPR